MQRLGLIILLIIACCNITNAQKYIGRDSVIFSCPNEHYIVQNLNNGHRGVVTSKGKIIVPIEWSIIKRTIYHNKYYYLTVDIDSYVKPLHGIYSTEGEELLPCVYYNIVDANSSLGYVFVSRGADKWGIVNLQTGKEVVRCLYSSIENFDDACRYVKVKNHKGKYGIIDYSHNVIIPCIYTLIEFSPNGNIQAWLRYSRNENQQEYDIYDSSFKIINKKRLPWTIY